MNIQRTQNLLLAFAILFAAGFLSANCSAALPPPDKSPLTEAEKQARFFAVAHVGDYVVAVNSNGFYRTQTSRGNWERISVPRGMPVQGQFAVSEANSNVVYFSTQMFLATKGCLYVSHDAGLRWTLVSDDYGFYSVHQNRDRRLYAIIWEKVGGTNQGVHSRLIMSENEGKSWKDISQNIFGDLYRIFADPKHPNRVCVEGNSIRGYIFESADDDYSKWTATVEWNWKRDSKTDDEFLQGGYSTCSTLYMLHANLNNYFQYDFNSAAEIPAFEISADTNRLTFKPEDTVEIPVTIKFREPGITVKLPDTSNGEEMWGIQLIAPSGERLRSKAKINRVGKPPESEVLRQQYRALPDFKIAEVSVTNSYSRKLSLSGLSDFSKPGNYRIRLWYESSDWRWERDEHSAHTIDSDLWAGSFCSPIFTLTIKP